MIPREILLILFITFEKGLSYITRLEGCKYEARFEIEEDTYFNGELVKAYEETMSDEDCLMMCMVSHYKCTFVNYNHLNLICEIQSYTSETYPASMKTVSSGSGWTFMAPKYNFKLNGQTCKELNPCPADQNCTEACNDQGYICTAGSDANIATTSNTNVETTADTNVATTADTNAATKENAKEESSAVTNVAKTRKGATTSQSTTYASRTSDYAIDGDVETYSRTKTREDQWWSVELKKSYKINHLYVHAVYEGGKLKVRIGDIAVYDDNPLCSEITRSMDDIRTLIECTDGRLTGKYIYVHSTYLTLEKMIRIKEIEAYVKDINL